MTRQEALVELEQEYGKAFMKPYRQYERAKNARRKKELAEYNERRKAIELSKRLGIPVVEIELFGLNK